MARAKSWSESQQPDNQYTYGQYWFNVIALLLMALALIAVLVYVLWPSPQASTKVFLVRPEAGSEVRSIPFQESDFAGLKNSFVDNEVVELDNFNDKESFEQVIDNLKDKLNGSNPTTAIIVCSAIGAVDENGNPILRSTTARGENIEVKEFLKDFVTAINCQRYIVILDCGHDFSRPSKYFENSKFQQGDDFNKFTTAVEKLVKAEALTEKPVAVITANGDGEIPLYSYNKRRTLFGLALQDAFSNSHADVDELCNHLVDYCYLHGGDAAQTPKLFKSENFDGGELRIAGLRVPAKEEEPDQEKDESEEEIQVQENATTKDLKQIAGFWRDRDEVEGKFDTKEETLLLPKDFQTLAWQRNINAIVEKTADLRNQKGLGTTSIGELGQSDVLRQARTNTNKFPGLLSAIEFSADPSSQSTSGKVDPEARRDIAKAFLVFHRAKLKAEYHMAIFESLSWLDSSPSLEGYEDAISKLMSSLSSPLFADAAADEKDLNLYTEANRDITGKLSDAEYRLENLCEFLGGDDKHGFTREMAIMCLLDSPLIESGSSEPDAVHEEHHRDGLMDALKREVVGIGDRISADIRKANSKRRFEMLAKLTGLCSPPDESEIESRKQDSIAYYFNAGPSKLLDLTVKPKPTVYNLVLENRSELEKTKQIELEDTEINLGLIVTAGTQPIETNVSLLCELPPSAPFEILNGVPEGNRNTVRINDSDGLIRIKATKNAAEAGAGSGHILKVQVEDSYLGEKFARNDAKLIEIPLAMPGEDRIELLLARSGKRVEGTALRPQPNRVESFEMSLVNFYHEARSVKATLHPCMSIEGHAIMPGSIDEEVKRKTLVDFRRLPTIAVSGPVELKKGKLGEPAEPTKIRWSAKPDPKLIMIGPEEPVIQGLLCRVVELDAEGAAGRTLKDFWIPVFPEDGDLFSDKKLLLDPDTGIVRFDYVKSELGKDKPIKLECRLGDQVVGGLSIPSGASVGTDDVIIENWGLFESKSKQELLHIDVDGWPRRYSFIFRNGQFLDAVSRQDLRFPSIEFDVSPPKPDAATIKLKEVTSSDSEVRQAFAYKSKTGEPTIEGVLKITCNTQEHFRFPRSNDSVEVKFGNDREKFFFPREVKSFVSADPTDPTRLTLESKVSDFDRNLNVNLDNYVIDPISIQAGGQTKQMNGKDITRIIFDDLPPKAPRFEIASNTFYPRDFIAIQLSQIVDSSGGVGVSKLIGNRIRATISSGGSEPKKAVLGYNQDRSLGLKAGEVGSYQLNIAGVDLLGNVSESTTKSFRVIPRPPKPKKKPKKAVVKTPPKPVTHVLMVTVLVNSRRINADEDPELVIKPDEGVKVKRNGDTYKFTGLKAGETYSVTGKLKLTTGFGVETEGKTSPWEIPEDSPRMRTKTKILSLEQ